MFFVVSKVFWLLAQPLSAMVGLIALALLLILFRRRKTAIAVLGVASLSLLVLGFTSFGYVIIQPLEDRFAVPTTPPETVSAIVVLGGATMARPSTSRHIAELNQAGDRLTTTLWLAQRYPQARVVLSGGEGTLTTGLESEATTITRFLVQFGISEDRLELEGRSRNTAENAAFTRNLLQNQTGAVVLVTSAFHMPRSVGLFEKEGVAVVPWPTDYRSAGNQGFDLDLANPNQNLETSTVAMREWVGLAAYYFTGKIQNFFPAPK